MNRPPTAPTASDDLETSVECSSETLKIAQPPQSGAWTLEVYGIDSLQRVALSTKPLVVGSGRGAGLRLDDRTVSSRHCEITVAGEGVAVRDLGSTNGTFVGGARIREAWGAEGSTITIGHTTLVCTTFVEEEDDDLGDPLPGVAGNSRAMRRVAARVRRLALLSAPVLVSGETGVGKELIARALHTEGPRAKGPFVAMNVASLPRELVESELFGHERGAFTGAVARKSGAFGEADGGTLFLDEIGELPIDSQPKLLRALDGYEVRRVGASGSGRRTDTRIVAATHVELAEHVAAGSFRRDLFHRLEVFVVELPPLRERPGDVVAITRVLLAQMAKELGPRELTPAAVGQLTSHDWPGNVRELRNVLCRAAEVSRRQRWIEASAVEQALRRAKRLRCEVTSAKARQCLEEHRGNVSAAARELKIPRTTFRKLIAQRDK